MYNASDNRNYHNWYRQDIIEHVPDNARNILSLGCGSGVTEAELVRRGAAVTGIEKSEAAAREAEKHGLRMLCGDADNCASLLGGELYDCLICADILEHLTDPSATLQSLMPLLRYGGTIIVSIPNFRYYSIIWALAGGGEIEYKDAGILDRTHLRITTQKMAARWLKGCGIRLQKLNYRILRRRDLLLNALSLGVLREFLATQVILTGERTSAQAS